MYYIACISLCAVAYMKKEKLFCIGVSSNYKCNINVQLEVELYIRTSSLLLLCVYANTLTAMYDQNLFNLFLFKKQMMWHHVIRQRLK